MKKYSLSTFVRFAFLGLILLAFLRPSAAAFSVQSGPAQTSLLELYTSEGCSSCPPADEWLGQTQLLPGLWTRFVPVVFHVDYWDYLGWKDRWASKLFTRRQNAYANAWKRESVVTPQFVLNGKEWLDWTDATDVSADGDAQAGILRLTAVGPNEFQIDFQPGRPASQGWEANVVILGMGLTSDVKAGENRGRTLLNNFAALGYEKARLTLGAHQTARVKVPYDEKNALALPARTARLAVAAWVTGDDGLRPIQAVGGFLSEPK